MSRSRQYVRVQFLPGRRGIRVLQNGAHERIHAAMLKLLLPAFLNDFAWQRSLDECSLSNYTFDLGDVLMRHALSEEASAPGLQRGRAAHVGTPSQIANRAEEAYGTRGDLAGLVRRSE